MKICFIIGALKFSGAEKVLSSLAAHLHQQGHDVHVVLTLPSEAAPQDPPFALHEVHARGARPLRILQRARRLRQTIKTIAPDVSVSFGYANNINCVPALIGNGVPHIVCERNNPIYDPPGRWPARLRGAIYPWASAAVFQTETIRNLFSARVRRKSAVIPNPVIDVYPSPPQESSKPERPSIVAVGRLSDRDKNQSLLIKAFARLASEFPSWTLDLYGDGPDRHVFEDLIQESGLVDRVRLCGQVENPYEALSHADVFALPSRTEGMPNALIEAMAVGVACVATDCSGGGVAALITHERNGLICANEDEASLATALRRLMSDRELRRSLGTEARKIRETHSLDRIGLEWLRVFHDQLG